MARRRGRVARALAADRLLGGRARSTLLDVRSAGPTTWSARRPTGCSAWRSEGVDSGVESRLRLLVVLVGLPDRDVDHIVRDEVGSILMRSTSAPPCRLLTSTTRRIRQRWAWSGIYQRFVLLDDRDAPIAGRATTSGRASSTTSASSRDRAASGGRRRTPRGSAGSQRRPGRRPGRFSDASAPLETRLLGPPCRPPAAASNRSAARPPRPAARTRAAQRRAGRAVARPVVG